MLFSGFDPTDKARHDHQVPPIDHPVGLLAIALADVNDRIAFERNIGISQIAMRFCAFVPGDDPIGILDKSKITHD